MPYDKIGERLPAFHILVVQITIPCINQLDFQYARFQILNVHFHLNCFDQLVSHCDIFSDQYDYLFMTYLTGVKS